MNEADTALLSATTCVCRAGRDVRVGKFLVPRCFACVARSGDRHPEFHLRDVPPIRAGGCQHRTDVAENVRVLRGITVRHLSRPRIERRDHARNQQRTDPRRDRNRRQMTEALDVDALAFAHLVALLARRRPLFELGHPLLRQREQADRRFAGSDAFEREPLALFLDQRVPHDICEQRDRNHDRTFAVADDHVARHDEHARARDRFIDRERHVLAAERRAVRRQVIDGLVQFGDRRRVAQRAVRDDAGRAELERARREDVADRRRVRHAARFDHQHVARLQRLDRAPLRVHAAAVLLLQIFAQRDVAQRARAADHPQFRMQRLQSREERAADAAHLQLMRERRGRDRLERLDALVSQHVAVVSFRLMSSV